MKENKITQDFLSTAYDVLSGKTSVVPTFQEQADEVFFEMWLNDEIQLEDTQYEELIDLYKQFENNKISEKQLEEGIGSALKAVAKGAGKVIGGTAKLAAKGVKKGVKRLSTQGKIDAGKKKIEKHKKKEAQKKELAKTKKTLSGIKKKKEAAKKKKI